jgi:hypothetical protein
VSASRWTVAAVCFMLIDPEPLLRRVVHQRHDKTDDSLKGIIALARFWPA